MSYTTRWTFETVDLKYAFAAFVRLARMRPHDLDIEAVNTNSVMAMTVWFATYPQAVKMSAQPLSSGRVVLPSGFISFLSFRFRLFLLAFLSLCLKHPIYLIFFSSSFPSFSIRCDKQVLSDHEPPLKYRHSDRECLVRTMSGCLTTWRCIHVGISIKDKIIQ